MPFGYLEVRLILRLLVWHQSLFWRDQVTLWSVPSKYGKFVDFLLLLLLLLFYSWRELILVCTFLLWTSIEKKPIAPLSTEPLTSPVLVRFSIKFYLLPRRRKWTKLTRVFESRSCLITHISSQLLLVVPQLSYKSRVRTDYISLSLAVFYGFLEGPLIELHQIGYDRWRTSRYSSETMHEYIQRFIPIIFDELRHLLEIFPQILCLPILHLYYPVNQIRVIQVCMVSYRQYSTYLMLLQNIRITGSVNIPQVETTFLAFLLKDAVNRIKC